METVCLNLPVPPSPKKASFDFSKVSHKRRTGGVNSRLPGALFNAQDPRFFIKHEQPWHVTAAQMASQGYSQKEIATITGKGKVYVSQILRQPATQLRMINEARKHVQDELKELLESRVIPNVKILASIADDSTAKAADRINAVNSMDNRLWGNPKQPIVTEGSFNPAKATPEELDRKASEILSRFVGAPGSPSSNGHNPTNNPSGTGNPPSPVAEAAGTAGLKPVG